MSAGLTVKGFAIRYTNIQVSFHTARSAPPFWRGQRAGCTAGHCTHVRPPGSGAWQEALKMSRRLRVSHIPPRPDSTNAFRKSTGADSLAPAS